jgi:hypothetical protein
LIKRVGERGIQLGRDRVMSLGAAGDVACPRRSKTFCVSIRRDRATVRKDSGVTVQRYATFGLIWRSCAVPSNGLGMGAELKQWLEAP